YNVRTHILQMQGIQHLTDLLYITIRPFFYNRYYAYDTSHIHSLKNLLIITLSSQIQVLNQKSLQRRAPPQLNFSTRGRFQINWQIKLSLHLEITINQKIYFDLHVLLSLVCPALLPEINCYDHDSFFILPPLLLLFGVLL